MFKNQILVFSLIGRETIPLKRCVLIGCHISTKLPVKKSARRKQMADTERGNFSEDEFSTALAEAEIAILVCFNRERHLTLFSNAFKL